MAGFSEGWQQSDPRGNCLIEFKGAQLPRSVILRAGFFCVGYTGSHRDLGGILVERGFEVATGR
jgi:hypothetical protein